MTATPAQTRPTIVVGLEAEARVARAWGVPVRVGGGTAEGAAHALAALPGAAALISFGLAGGLDPALRPGDLVVPHTVIDGDESWATDEALNRLLGGVTPHTLLGGGTVLATAAAKRAAARQAQAVDLESAAVAREAARRCIPFAVLRAICDPADRDLPHAALVALDARGRIGPLRILAAVLGRPQDIPALIHLGSDAARARAALARRVAATTMLDVPP